jgi:protein-S-isoprenylcysteine O-methyltransferase Ste14
VSQKVLVALFPILSLPHTTLESVHADPLPVLIPVVPALALICLFLSSTLFTESISLSKYPEAYRQYQRRVGMLLPLPLGWLLSERERANAERAIWGSDKVE